MVEPTRYEIGKLHFDNGFHSGNRQSQTRTNDSRLTNWRIANTIFSEFIHKTFSHLENTTIIGNILSHDDQIFVLTHGQTQSVLNCINQPHFSCATSPFYNCIWIFSKQIGYFFFSIRNYIWLRIGYIQSILNFLAQLFFNFFHFRFRQ